MVKRYDIPPTLDHQRMWKFYDISDPVGIPLAPKDTRNPPNHRLDVLLVQYMLNKHYDGASLKPAGTLHADGIFGPMTHYWMMFFYVEQDSKSELGQLPERGNFVPFMRNTYKIFTDRAQSLIGVLNNRTYRKVPSLFAEVPRPDPHMPADLKHALFKP
ncbi:hypothetical protein [Reyranella sp. CPCC 100927]|uniref:hypothetical protein n=1 Tax=Reyranella sp. CPCC 100927 TaxID=2599616 RepID=UPI0011B71715|nr:hypothetical protein [Reyranella sp. CPCC 100927]TWT04988.1 hypothetical protein FQU96_25365 [Reyranella sp. CPCC 100927]